MKRVVALLSAIVMALSIAGFDRSAQAAPLAPAAGSVGLFTPTLTLVNPSCGTSHGRTVQCLTLTVPLDYANPDNGKTVKLAVTRIAADPLLSYQGIMVVNPGGPGGAGTGLVGLGHYVPGNGSIANRYDWIGFDPRGVGSSTPALHCNPKYFGNNRPNFNPRTKALQRYWVKKSKRYAKACANSAAAKAGLLAHMTTRDSAMDMESLRQALHDEISALDTAKRAKVDKLNFYGFSYGTYLGAVYAQLYPSKVGRFVLDGVVDPARFWYQSNFDQSIGFDRNINVFFAWMAKHHKVFHLGTKGRKIRAGFNRELKKLDKHPAAGRKLGPDELIDAMLGAGYYVYGWAETGAAYSKLIRKGRGGDLYAMYRDGNQGADADNGYAVYLGVQCTDQRRPPLAQQLRQTRKVNRKAPFLAWDNTWYNMPCLTWAAPSRGKVKITGSGLNALGTKILLINETKDAATPYSGALKLRSIFTGASLIAGVNGTTHAGSLSGVSCVDNRIAQYLADGTVPTRLPGRRADVKCPRVPPPPANGSAGRVAARSVAGAAGSPVGLRAGFLGPRGFGS